MMLAQSFHNTLSFKTRSYKPNYLNHKAHIAIVYAEEGLCAFCEGALHTNPHLGSLIRIVTVDLRCPLALDAARSILLPIHLLAQLVAVNSNAFSSGARVTSWLSHSVCFLAAVFI